MGPPPGIDATRPLTLVGAPADSVGEQGGAEHCPAAVRELGLVGALGGADSGDLAVRIRGAERDPETGILAAPDVLATTATVREAVAGMLAAGERPFVAGGCCSIVPGALAGARDALGSVGLAYVDGHTDLYDGRTSPSGEAADMPISVALGRGPDRWVAAAGGPSVDPDRTALVGYRDRDESRELGAVQPEQVSGLAHVPIDAVRAQGPAAVGAQVAETLAARGAFWLHLDVDVLDEEVFPATDYLMPGGMTWEELAAVLDPLARSPALAGASLGCYNPQKDDSSRGCGRTLVAALRAALGR